MVYIAHLTPNQSTMATFPTLGDVVDMETIPIVEGGSPSNYPIYYSAYDGGEAIYTGNNCIDGGSPYTNGIGVDLKLYHTQSNKIVNIHCDQGEINEYSTLLLIHFNEKVPSGQYNYEMIQNGSVLSKGILRLVEDYGDSEQYDNIDKREIYE